MEELTEVYEEFYAAYQNYQKKLADAKRSHLDGAAGGTEQEKLAKYMEDSFSLIGLSTPCNKLKRVLEASDIAKKYGIKVDMNFQDAGYAINGKVMVNRHASLGHFDSDTEFGDPSYITRKPPTIKAGWYLLVHCDRIVQATSVVKDEYRYEHINLDWWLEFTKELSSLGSVATHYREGIMVFKLEDIPKVLPWIEANSAKYESIAKEQEKSVKLKLAKEALERLKES